MRELPSKRRDNVNDKHQIRTLGEEGKEGKAKGKRKGREIKGMKGKKTRFKWKKRRQDGGMSMGLDLDLES